MWLTNPNYLYFIFWLTFVYFQSLLLLDPIAPIMMPAYI